MVTTTNNLTVTLDASLREVVARVRGGETIGVVENGRIIAEIVPASLDTSLPGVKPDVRPEIDMPTTPAEAWEVIKQVRKQIAERERKLGLKPMTDEEIVALKHEGHRY